MVENSMVNINRQFAGFPLKLYGGYVAITLFMTANGFEMAFLSRYIVELGFTSAQASLIFTIYGLAAALAAWISGVVAEIITPQRTMLVGLLLWCVFHVSFLKLGLYCKDYLMIILFYGLRGFAYPLFLYPFLVIIVHNVNAERIGAAIGWFWAMYSFGIGVAGSYLSSFAVPYLGEMNTLWLALVFAVIGGIVAMVSLRHVDITKSAGKLAEITYAVKLLRVNKSIFYTSIVRIINTVSLFGLPVIMPMVFVDELKFTLTQWLQVWAVFFATTIFGNIFWGVVSEKIEWIRMIRWYGCLGASISTLGFYYLPVQLGSNIYTGILPAIGLGFFIAAFVPISGLFTLLEPEHKGAALSACNLSAGLSNFLGPAIAYVLLPLCGVEGIVITYSLLYIAGFFLTYLIKFARPIDKR